MSNWYQVTIFRLELILILVHNKFFSLSMTFISCIVDNFATLVFQIGFSLIKENPYTLYLQSCPLIVDDNAFSLHRHSLKILRTWATQSDNRRLIVTHAILSFFTEVHLLFIKFKRNEYKCQCGFKLNVHLSVQLLQIVGSGYWSLFVSFAPSRQRSRSVGTICIT